MNMKFTGQISYEQISNRGIQWHDLLILQEIKIQQAKWSISKIPWRLLDPVL